MKTNRKEAESYRLNGHLRIPSGSIHPVTIAELEARISDLETKLASPGVARWTAH